MLPIKTKSPYHRSSPLLLWHLSLPGRCNLGARHVPGHRDVDDDDSDDDYDDDDDDDDGDDVDDVDDVDDALSWANAKIGC